MRARRRAQLVADAGQGHGDARVVHVAQLHEEDALLVAAQPGHPHIATRAAAPRGGGEREDSSNLFGVVYWSKTDSAARRSAYIIP